MHAVERRRRRAAAAITRASGRPVTWLALFAHPGQPDYHEQTFAKLGDLVKQAIPQVTPRPIMSQGDLKNPTMFASFLSWQKAFNRPTAEQIALYRDPGVPEAFQLELESRKRGQCGARCACSRWAAGARRNVGRTSRRSRPARASGRWTPTSTWASRTTSHALSVVHLQLRSGGHRAAHHRRSLPHRALRRRRARRRHLRRGLRDRHARSLGAPARRAESRGAVHKLTQVPQRCSASPTAACWPRERSPTWCCSIPPR